MKTWVREAARRARQPSFGPSLDYEVNRALLCVAYYSIHVRGPVAVAGIRS